MTRWVIEVRRKHDEVLVIVDKDDKFFDDVSFHPSERQELLNYLTEVIQAIIKEVTSDVD